MKKRLLFLLAVLVVVVACYAQGKPSPARNAQEDAIREAVFRYQFNHNASGIQQKAAIYFLSINAKDPSTAFMKRFVGNRPTVKKSSEADSSPRGIEDKKTKQRGLIFRTEGIRWVNENEVQVKGGYYEANLSASWNTYDVAKKGGKWFVVKDQMNGIA